MKTFISYATVDREIASKLADLIQLGIGVPRSEIFFSLYSGSIPNAEYFVQYILKELNSSGLVVAILSKGYFESEFCLAEAGAALARKENGDAEFYSLVVPPEKLSALGGVLYGRQTGYITAPAALDELRAVYRRKGQVTVDDPTWGVRQREFLTAATQHLNHSAAEALSSRIRLHTMHISRDPESATGIEYKLKLRITLKNETGKTIQIGPATWGSGINMIRLQSPPVSPLKWQVETDVGWGNEASEVSVADGRFFRTWVGVKPSTPDCEFLSRHVEKTLGELQIAAKIDGVEVNVKIGL